MNLTQEHLTAEDEHERLYGSDHERFAATCYGPGHLLNAWDERIEDCPECKGRGPRNHSTARYAR